ncbi:MAG: dihydroorotase [Rhodospirillales bacterium]|nr:dihydroorotase [Rhodospirillales bacterium]MDP6774180.1 dihydroorotase [Rhodospirillales bacterium]
MSGGPQIITLRRPDDWHLHLRDGAMLDTVLPYSADCFGRAIIMPNLVPPVTDTAMALAYRERITRALPEGASFQPLMTGYLTDQTDADEIERGYGSGVLAAMKLYPAGATTHSDAGVTDMGRVGGVLARMEKIGMPLLVHGEVVGDDVDVFDREAVFIERVLAPTLQSFAGLKVVLEHVTTAEGVAFVRDGAATIGATITAHHLMINRNALFAGGIRPHMYCLPVAKRERHRLALRQAATSGEACFFLGTDSAPHPASDKESACGCAGIFSAPAAIGLYAQVFEEEGAIEHLEAFASLNGPRFYGLPANEDTITLERRPWPVPERLAAGPDEIIPFAAGEDVAWRVVEE